MKTTFKNDLVKAVSYFAAALAFVLLAVFLSSKINPSNPTVVQPTASPTTIVVRPQVECPPDFLAYTAISKDPERVVKLISGKKVMFAKNGKFVNTQIVITKNDTKESKVACGYLYVKVGTGAYGPLQEWENLYINPNDFGGHINAKSQIGPGDGRNLSEYVFSLSKMEYWKTKSRGSLLTADWAALLNVSETVKFEIALNTTEKTGFIEELSLTYKCWNPQTGEENSGCKLNITNANDKFVDKLQ